MNASPNRVVAIATPLIFAPLAGAVTALAAKYAPGLDIDEGQLEAVFIAGAAFAVAKGGLWLKGWQDYEKRQEAMNVAAFESAGDPYPDSDESVGDPYPDLDDVVEDDEEIEDELDADFDEEAEDEEAEDEDRDLVMVGQGG